MRLIDADALGVGRCSRDLLPAAYCAGWNGLVGLIEQAPTIDAVPVVRCKDCKYYKPPKQSAHWEHKVPYCCRVTTVKVTPDSFCSYGERKDGDNHADHHD